MLRIFLRKINSRHHSPYPIWCSLRDERAQGKTVYSPVPDGMRAQHRILNYAQTCKATVVKCHRGIQDSFYR